MSKSKLNIAIVGLGFGKEFIPIYQLHPETRMYASASAQERSRPKWAANSASPHGTPISRS